MMSMNEREALPPSTMDSDTGAPEAMTPMAVFAVVLTGILAFVWFVVSWLVLHSPLTDAIGETAGSLAVALLVISILGAVHRR